MKMSLDCIACFVRQAADAVKISASSEADRKLAMHNVLQWIVDMIALKQAVEKEQTILYLADNAGETFFLFRIKCPTISCHSGFCVGSYVVANRFSMPDYASGVVL